MNDQFAALPMPKDLLSLLKEAGIKEVLLRFSGGSDEGHLYVELTPDLNTIGSQGLESKVYDWAQDAYEYSGAGDGSDYGDNYTYDLEAKTVAHEWWYHEPVSDSSQPVSFDDLTE